MIARLRRKFVLVSVLSLALVLAVLVIGINVGVRYFNARSADELLAQMASQDGRIPGQGVQPPHQRPWDYPVTEETPFETRYFAVLVDESGEVSDVRLDYISATDIEGALEYLDEAKDSDVRSGYIDNYRFLVGDTEEGTLYLFLDCSRFIRTQELVLLISVAGSLAVLTATALLLFAFSRRAVSPVVRSVERQKRFITDAGHELKTPITAIMSAADVLALDYEDNEWVKSIQGSSSRLARLTADLIDLSRFDEADPFPDRERFDLSAELSGLCEAFRLTAGAAGHEIQVDITPEIHVVASREAVARVAGILLDNAMRYSDAGGAITIMLARRRSHAVLEVSNPCKGMTKETVSRMFERFYRGDASRSTAGTGVGLSMARAIVEAHGGRIDAAYDRRAAVVTVTVTLAAQ